MTTDISDEASNYVAPGVQHKYAPTLVIIISDKCQKICDWCFRGRMFVGKRLEYDKVADLDSAVKYAKEHTEIRNVLMTGGDAFLADKNYLKRLVTELDKIEHIRSYRFGTRAIIYDPKMYYDIKEIFELTKKLIYIPIHLVHPDDVTAELAKITSTEKSIFLNQTPLLKTINYDADILEALLYKMEEAEIHGYYVFQCRAVDGNEKYVTTLKEGHDLLEEVKKRLSGVTKRFRYAMSADAGKLEIVGVEKGLAYLHFHQAKDPENWGRLITTDANAVWLVAGKPLYLKEGKFSF
jgi:lysine 2,3-aminomutase